MMTEKEFYATSEKLEGAKLPSGMGTFYPSAEDLEASIQGKPIEEMMPVLLFYASDPFKDQIADDSYKETVKCAKRLTCNIPLA